jgi:hypothetical protein
MNRVVVPLLGLSLRSAKSYGEIPLPAITCAKKNGLRDFRVHTASTKVTQSELAELEHAAPDT